MQLEPLVFPQLVKRLYCHELKHRVWQLLDLGLLIVLAAPQPSELGNGDLVSSQIDGAANATQADCDCRSILYVNNFQDVLSAQSHDSR